MDKLPPREDFSSLLRDCPTINEIDYETVKDIWNTLKVHNLYELFHIYLALDCTLLADALKYYFQKIYETTGLYPYHFMTIR